MLSVDIFPSTVISMGYTCPDTFILNFLISILLTFTVLSLVSVLRVCQSKEQNSHISL